MELDEPYPDIILNDDFKDSLRNSSVKFYQSNKPVSFDDSSIDLRLQHVNNDNQKIFLMTPITFTRRYSDTSITKYCEYNSIEQKDDYRWRRRCFPRQLSVQKSTVLEDISLNILKANCSFGGFKQLQKVTHLKKDCRNEQPFTVDPTSNTGTSILDLDSISDHEQAKRNVNGKDSNRMSLASNSSTKADSPYQKNDFQNRFRLGYRKTLQERRRRISDYSLCSAIFGIIAMILMTEFQWAGLIKQNSSTVYFLKSLITLSTMVLIIFILIYHFLVIQLFSCDDCLEDWRIIVTWQRISQMVLEIGICSIHPFPFLENTDFKMGILDISHQHMLYDDRVPLDLILSLPMFLRFYLVFRVILLHSKLFSDAGLRSIGAINKVTFDTRFLLKTLLTICPATVFILFVLSMWLFFSWVLRACEIRVDPRHNSLLNSTWLIAITFLSVGYGEMVPHTACGRCIAISSGVMGSACTALIVAVLAKKLELTKAEQHVTYFILNNKIKNKLRNCAANVLRETWLIYKFTKLVDIVDLNRIRSHQRKFLKAIHGLRKIKIDQRKLRDNSNTLVDLAKTIQTGLLSQPSAYISKPVELYRETQHSIYKTVSEMREEYITFHKRIENIEKSVLNLQRCLTHFAVDIKKSHQIS